MKTLSVKVPLYVDAALDRLAAARRQTKSSIVREAIEGVVQGGVDSTEASCGQLATDLAGRFSGPRDLSTGKRHMKGYGQ